jgi:hypothetical protein
MNHDELKRTFQSATAAPPLGSRERVWRALEAPPARPSQLRLVPLFLAATVAGIALVFFVLRKPEPTRTVAAAVPLRWSDPHSAILSATATTSFDAATRQLKLEQGEVALSSWGAPLELFAAGHTVRVEAGVVVVRVAGASVEVSPVAGVSSFDGTAVRATSASRVAAGALGEEILGMESTTARPRRMLSRADEFVAERDFAGAVETFGAVAELGGLDAEVALYKKGELQLRELAEPEAALRTFDDGDARFARGGLQQERQLSAIEACVKLERWSEVRNRTQQFLAQHADSERAGELKVLHASARAASGDLAGACAELAALPADQGAELRAQCR